MREVLLTEEELVTLLLNKKIKSKCTKTGYYTIINVEYKNKQFIELELKDEDSSCNISTCFHIDDLVKIQERLIN